MQHQTDEKHLYQVFFSKIAVFLFISPSFSARADHPIVELNAQEGITPTDSHSRADKTKPDILSLDSLLKTRSHTSVSMRQKSALSMAPIIFSAMCLNLSDMTKLYKQILSSI